MRKRTIAALLACTMVLGTITGCSSEPKNPEDSDTEAVQVSTELQQHQQVQRYLMII